MAAIPEQKNQDVTNQPTLTEQEVEARSWMFLDKIAALVAKFPKSIQDDILNEGKRLKDAEVLYVHVINKKAVMEEIKAMSRKKEVEQSRQ